MMVAAAAAPAAAEPVEDPPPARPEVASAAVPRPPGPDAQPAATPGETATSRERTWTDVAGAPVPGTESGRIDAPGGDSIWRIGMRGVLFVPRIATDVVLSPVKLTAWAYDRYHLDRLCYRVFFNDARTIGLVPTAAYDSGFGRIGVRDLTLDELRALRIATARPGFDGQTFVHVARDPATGAPRVVGIWRS